MQLTHFDHSLQKSKDINQINKILKDYLRHLKINTFSFTYYATHPKSKEKIQYDFSSLNFSAWHNHYIQEGYSEIDTTFLDVYQTTVPVFWDIHQQLKSAKSPREKQMRLDSIEFNIEKGVCIPIHGPRGDLANLLVVQMKGEKCLENWHELQYELLAIAHYYYTYLQKYLIDLQTEDHQYHLTQREMQCLLLIGQQHTVSQIAEKLDLTERTVNFHIQNINKKLGTQNKYQSLAKALEKNLLTL